VGAVDGSVIYRSERNGSQHDAERLGIEVAEDLLKQGAKAILDAIKLS
jgi:hydroxymethylbilane synthase